MPRDPHVVKAECMALRGSHSGTIPGLHHFQSLRSVPGQIPRVDQKNVRTLLALWNRDRHHERGHPRAAAHEFVTTHGPSAIIVRSRSRLGSEKIASDTRL